MNRSDLRTRVRALTNVYSTALLSDAAINSLLSETHYEICGLRPWPTLTASTEVTTEAGEPSVELPAGAREVLTVANRAADGARRALAPVSEFDNSALSHAPGLPRFYVFHFGDSPTLDLAPVPVAAETLTVVYQSTPEAFDGDTDEPPFADEFHPAYAYLAGARALSDLGGDEKRIRSLLETAGQFIERMRRFYITASDRTPIRIGSRRTR